MSENQPPQLSRLDLLAAKLDNIVILGKDNWRIILLSVLSPYAPRIMLNSIDVRANLHVLFPGDTSSAKSQIFNVLKKFAPKWESISKATEASMEGSAVSRKIKAGIIEEANDGILLVPEFQSAYYNHMQVLREALDCQEIRVFKKGERRSFIPNISLMGACNPTDDFFVQGIELRDQVKFKEGLLSRFDVMIPLLVTPALNEQVVEHMNFFGEIPAGINWTEVRGYFNMQKNRMQQVKRTIITSEQQNLLRETFKKHNRRPQLAKRPFVVLRDVETLLRLTNVLTAFNSEPTGAAAASDQDIELAISLWEHLLNIRWEFYTEHARRILTIPEQIIQTVTSMGGTAQVEGVKTEIVDKKSICSQATFYRKLEQLREDGVINHQKGPGATIQIIGASTSYQEKS